MDDENDGVMLHNHRPRGDDDDDDEKKKKELLCLLFFVLLCDRDDVKKNTRHQLCVWLRRNKTSQKKQTSTPKTTQPTLSLSIYTNKNGISLSWHLWLRCDDSFF